MQQVAKPTRPAPDASHVWDVLWHELERIVATIDAVLGAHLRERPLAARRKLGGASLVVGRSRLGLELGVERRPPPVFRSGGRVVRLSAFAESSLTGRREVATLWADPETLHWTSTETEGELLRLDDQLSLERFFLTLLVDAA